MKPSFKYLLGAIAFSAIQTGLSSTQAHATCAPDTYIGSVCWTAATFCPPKFAEANGQLLAITSYDALYSVIGTYYGGNGRTTFALPDLRGRAATGVGQGFGLTNTQIGRPYGRESYKIQVSNIPAHSHTVSVGDLPITGNVVGVTEGGTQIDPTNALPAARIQAGKEVTWKKYYSESDYGEPTPMARDAVKIRPNPSITETSTAFTSPANQSALPLRPPQLTLRACVALKGFYPPRS